MMPSTAESLAGYRDAGYVVAPAGFGKTYLIAQSTSLATGRQLVLTHTYAGADALRRKMQTLGVSNRLFHIDTIASWALRLSLSYSDTSRWQAHHPTGDQWTRLYQVCVELLDATFVRRIVRASYTGLYVDEYQDCSVYQHQIVLKLAQDLPCRILGDPLQGIFDFNDQAMVDWEENVENVFAPLGTLDVPHRWNNVGAGELGGWLRKIRGRLEAGDGIDLDVDLPKGISLKKVSEGADTELVKQQGNACRYFRCDPRHTVIAIHKEVYKQACHKLSRNLSGSFYSIEEVEGKSLFSAIRTIDHAQTVASRLKKTIDVAACCMTHVKENLPAGSKRGERVHITRSTKNPLVAQRCNEYLETPSSAALERLFVAIKDSRGVHLTRGDLFYRLMAVLRHHARNPGLSIVEAADQYHRTFRYKGRPIRHRRLIGTTLLVKGLEFDHAIVLDAASLSTTELYVALTRGARSLTIISSSPSLNPQP